MGVDGRVNVFWYSKWDTNNVTRKRTWGTSGCCFPHIEFEPSFPFSLSTVLDIRLDSMSVALDRRGWIVSIANGWGEVVEKRKLSTRDSYSPTIFQSSHLYSQLSLSDRHPTSTAAELSSSLSCRVHGWTFSKWCFGKWNNNWPVPLSLKIKANIRSWRTWGLLDVVVDCGGLYLCYQQHQYQETTSQETSRCGEESPKGFLPCLCSILRSTRDGMKKSSSSAVDGAVDWILITIQINFKTIPNLIDSSSGDGYIGEIEKCWYPSSSHVDSTDDGDDSLGWYNLPCQISIIRLICINDQLLTMLHSWDSGDDCVPCSSPQPCHHCNPQSKDSLGLNNNNI